MTLSELREALDACKPYLKPGQTPAARMEQDHQEMLVLMRLWAKEKESRDITRRALQDVVSTASENARQRDAALHHLQEVMGAARELEQFMRKVVGGDEAPVSIVCEDIYAEAISERLNALCLALTRAMEA